MGFFIICFSDSVMPSSFELLYAGHLMSSMCSLPVTHYRLSVLIIDLVFVWLTVYELLLSSQHLRVTMPETVALQRLTEHVDDWTEQVQTALTSDSIAQICWLTDAETVHCKNSDITDEVSATADQSDSSSSKEISSELGITV